MFDKISRSWSLAGQCWDVLKEDPKLLVFPLLSAIALLLLLGSFAVPAIAMYRTSMPSMMDSGTGHTSRLLFYVTTYLFYVASYTVMMFFNSALISVALKKLDGEPASIGDGLRMALAKMPAIVGYALIAATVGTLLRAIEERVGFIGRIVVSIIGAGWTLATAMTLPALVAEGIGPVQAISRSLDLLRSNWGENLIGNGGISLGVAVVAIPVAVIAMMLMLAAIATHAIGTIVLAVLFCAVAAAAVGAVSTTLHTIYTAALYRFATGSKDNAGVDGGLLADAYRQK